MAKKLSTFLVTDFISLESQELVLLYRDKGDYSKNIPDMYGAVRLIHQSNPGVWDIKYRDIQTAGLRDGLIYLSNYDTVVGVSGASDDLIGKK